MQCGEFNVEAIVCNVALKRTFPNVVLLDKTIFPGDQADVVNRKQKINAFEKISTSRIGNILSDNVWQGI